MGDEEVDDAERAIEATGSGKPAGESSPPQRRTARGFLSMRNLLGAGLVLILVVVGVVVHGSRNAGEPTKCVPESDSGIDVVYEAERDKSVELLYEDLEVQVAESERANERASDPQLAAEIKEDEAAMRWLAERYPDLDLNLPKPHSTDAYLTRSAAVLAPVEEPLLVVNLGDRRDPRLAQVELHVVNRTDSVVEDSTPETLAGGSDATELPSKPELEASVSMLSSSSGGQIPASQVKVWALRVGDAVILTACVDPSSSVTAGKYEGHVRLVDPYLTDVRMPIEVTAQSKFLDWLFLLLVISPILAFAYVWVTSRHSSGADPWDWSAFKRWSRENLVIAFSVGFAAVWATLAVPFSNPTWGSSVLASLAFVGVGLVAAITAMTAVTGRVREPGE